MNKIKLEYEAPEANTFVVRFEGSLLQTSVTTNGIRSLSYDEDELDC